MLAFLEAWKPINASTNLHKHKSSFVSDQPDVISLSLNEEPLIRVDFDFQIKTLSESLFGRMFQTSSMFYKLVLCIILFVCLSQAYLWDSNEDVVEWLERQLAEDEGARSVVDENIKYIRRDHILKQIRR